MINDDPDAPITDIIFVKGIEDCPEDYKVIHHCPCGHHAQLWENVRGETDRERYLAYTKLYKDGRVIDDIVITDGSEQYLRPGFVVMRKTLDGEKPLRHRDVALKTADRKTAKSAIHEVVVFRCKDKNSKEYKRIVKIDGMYVCVRSGPISEKYRKRPETATNELSPPPAPAVTDHDHRTPSPVLRSSPPLVDAHHAVLYQQDPPLQTHSSPPHHTGVEHMGSHQSYHSETIAMATHTFPQMTHPSSAPSTNFPPPIGFQQTYNPATQPPGYPPTANMQGYPTPGYQYGNVGVAPMMGGVPVGNMRGAIPPYPMMNVPPYPQSKQPMGNQCTYGFNV